MLTEAQETFILEFKLSLPCVMLHCICSSILFLSSHSYYSVFDPGLKTSLNGNIWDVAIPVRSLVL